MKTEKRIIVDSPFQVAVKYYGRPNKSLTPALHNSIENFFQTKHGQFAGWAQGYLFYSNSKKDVKPDKIPVENKNTVQNKMKKSEKGSPVVSDINNVTDSQAIIDGGNLIDVLPRTRSKRRKVKS